MQTLSRKTETKTETSFIISGFFNIVYTLSVIFIYWTHTHAETASFPLPVSSYVNAQDFNLILTQNGPFFHAVPVILSICGLFTQLMSHTFGRPSCACSFENSFHYSRHISLIQLYLVSFIYEGLVFQGIFWHVV